jgi:hypothetical protein
VKNTVSRIPSMGGAALDPQWTTLNLAMTEESEVGALPSRNQCQVFHSGREYGSQEKANCQQYS